jgi:hypothetical protein
MTLAAILIGDAPAAAQRYAAGELARLHLDNKEYPLYDALAEGRGAVAEPVPRAQWPTSYLTPGPAVLYARTSWRPGSIWLASMCSKTLDADHTQPNAGNLVISRGADEVLIDPSPYGSMSSLTSNAPTVESKQLPAEYHPSQAYWSQATGFRWAVQTRGGVIATRCDYADQYRFQDVPSDVPAAVRDVVVVPWTAADATAVVVDRATSGDVARGLWLRFRSAGTFAMGAPGVAQATIGGSGLTVRRIASSGGAPEVRALPVADCFTPATERGKCDAARVPTGEYRLTVPGPEMSAVHVLDVAAARAAAVTITPLAGAPEVLHLRRGTVDAYVATAPRASYTVPTPAPGTAAVHVMVPAGAAATITVASAAVGATCALTFGGADGVAVPAQPAIVRVDDHCRVTADPVSGPAAPAMDGTSAGSGAVPMTSPVGPAATGARARTARHGCLDVGVGPRGLLVPALALWLLRRRRPLRPRVGRG